MKKFKHSGTLGDIIYSLSLVKHFGGGEFFLHLNQVDWIAKHYYNSEPSPYHKGKMNQKDIDFMRSFFEHQPYISKFDPLDPSVEITHNLDRFRPLFVHHPTNYVGVYCQAFGINDPATQDLITSSPWITIQNPVKIPAKPIVVNRTSRGWTPAERNPLWDQWHEQGYDLQSRFVGLPEEYEEFKKFSGWELDYHPVKDLLELAQVIAGADLFIGNQSVALSIAQALQVPYKFERRRDLPLERNESYFPTHTQGSWF
jgi:hypothetical protein